MTDDLGEIFAGSNSVRDQDLSGALTEILEAQREDEGRLDAPAFWAFAGMLADGGGISDEIEECAAALIASEGIYDDRADLWQRWQWAVLFCTLRRLHSTDRQSWTDGAILPRSFDVSAMMALARNRCSVDQKGDNPDLFGTNSVRGGEDEALARIFRRMLVKAVMFRAYIARPALSESEIARRLFKTPPGTAFSSRTWNDWKKEAAEGGEAQIKALRARVRASVDRQDGANDYSDEDIERMWKVAYRPR